MSASVFSNRVPATLIFIILLLIESSVALAGTDTKAMLRDKTNDIYRALIENDTTYLENTYSEDFLITAQSFHVADKKQLIESQEAPEGSTFKIADWRAIESGDTVVALYKITWSFSDGGSNEARFTDVWVKRDGVWRILASHASQISLK